MQHGSFYYLPLSELQQSSCGVSSLARGWSYAKRSNKSPWKLKFYEQRNKVICGIPRAVGNSPFDC